MNIAFKRKRQRKKSVKLKKLFLFCFVVYIFSYLFAFSNIDKIKAGIINTAASALFETAAAEAVNSSVALIDGIESDEGGFYLKSENLIKLKSAIIKETKKGINKTETLFIPFGNFTGIGFLEGLLYPIPVRVSFMGSVKVSFRENFESCGVNQSIYTLKMCVEAEMYPLFSNEQNEAITLYTEYILAERLIMGQVPSYYSQNR